MPDAAVPASEGIAGATVATVTPPPPRITTMLGDVELLLT